MIHYPIYLDYNATTPCDKRVLDAMIPYFSENFGNAASKSHAYGWVASEAVDIAREQIASLIHAEPSEIIFTSGATEAVNLAIRGTFERLHSKGKHIIISSIEHKAVLDTCKAIEQIGAEVTVLPVTADGVIKTEDLLSAIRSDTILIALMYANNEIGTIFPIKEIGKIAKDKGILFFTDATQAAGKIDIDVQEDGIDLMSLSAHKMYGPKGVGVLYVRRKNPRVKVNPIIHGGGHESGMRSGTLNVPGIVGMGKAAEICKNEMKEDSKRIEILRDLLLEGLVQINGTMLNGKKELLLPNTANVSFSFIASNILVSKLNRHLAIATGSACTSASIEPSYVLRALGIGDELASSSIRFSLGRYTTESDIESAIQYIKSEVAKL